MTKFEEDLNEKLNSEKVPMYITQKGCSLTRKTFIETNWLFDNYKNWHSDEEFQEHVLANKNLIDVNTKLAEEIANLKSQLQQQALPVVPECVAELIKHAKDNNKTIRWCLYGNCKELYPQAAEWIGADDDIEFTDKTWKQQELFVRAWLDGYTVEKPQLFYLKNKLTGAYLYYDEATKLYSDIVGKVEGFFGTKTKFTEAEIGSMETGSYEQIKVEGD